MTYPLMRHLHTVPVNLVMQLPLMDKINFAPVDATPADTLSSTSTAPFCFFPPGLSLNLIWAALCHTLVLFPTYSLSFSHFSTYFPPCFYTCSQLHLCSSKGSHSCLPTHVNLFQWGILYYSLCGLLCWSWNVCSVIVIGMQKWPKCQNQYSPVNAVKDWE